MTVEDVRTEWCRPQQARAGRWMMGNVTIVRASDLPDLSVVQCSAETALEPVMTTSAVQTRSH